MLAADITRTEHPAGSLTRLLLRCATGDRVAFRAVYDAEAARLHGLALRITGQPSLAADAVHDTFLQVWENAGQFDPDRGSAEAWLTGLLRFRAIDLLRKRPRVVSDEALSDVADPDPGPMDRLLTTTQGARLQHCLGGLEPQQRDVIVLAFIQGLSHTDLADRLGTPLGTIKSWIRRGLGALKRCLEP